MSDTLRLLLQLIDIAPILERAFGDDWKSYRDELLGLSGRLERDGCSAALDKDLDALLARLLATATEETKGAIRKAMAPVGEKDTWRAGGVFYDGGVVAGGEAMPALPDHVVEVPVFYGTDRKLSDANDHYEGRRGDGVSYGVARVTVPTEGRDLGELTSPKWWKLEFKADPEHHVILTAVDGCDRASFVAQLQSALATADERDLLLFVHGYNVTFTDAARRAAQLAVDLKFRGSLSFGVGKGSGPIGYPGTQAWAYRCGGNLARWSLPADSVWTKRGCRERPWGQAGDNSQVFQSVRARCATSCPRLAPTHPPFAHTAPRSPRCGPGTPAAQQQLAF